MRNVAGEELLDWMAVLDCKHVASLHQMPASMGDTVCARLAGQTRVCDSCRAPRTVVRAGMWDWTVWEQMRDERNLEQHLVSLAHSMGWCLCEPEPAISAA